MSLLFARTLGEGLSFSLSRRVRGLASEASQSSTSEPEKKSSTRSSSNADSSSSSSQAEKDAQRKVSPFQRRRMMLQKIADEVENRTASVLQEEVTTGYRSKTKAKAKESQTPINPSELHLANYPPTKPFEKFSPIPKSHGIRVASIDLQSYNKDLKMLQFYSQFVLRSARAFGLPTTGLCYVPTKTRYWTLLKGPFVHKKYQENFWRRTHRRAIQVYDGHPEVVEAWLAYLKENSFPNVQQKATIYKFAEPGWGKSLSDMVSKEDAEEALYQRGGRTSVKDTSSPLNDAEAIKTLAGSLMEELKHEVSAREAELDQQKEKLPRLKEAEELLPGTKPVPE